MSQPYTPPAANAGAPMANNMTLAIIATVVSISFCCGIPHGLISLLCATQVAKKAQAGDTEGAMKSAKQAKIFAWISIVVSVVGLVLAFVFGVIGGILSAISK